MNVLLCSLPWPLRVSNLQRTKKVGNHLKLHLVIIVPIEPCNKKTGNTEISFIQPDLSKTRTHNHFHSFKPQHLINERKRSLKAKWIAWQKCDFPKLLTTQQRILSFITYDGIFFTAYKGEGQSITSRETFTKWSLHMTLGSNPHRSQEEASTFNELRQNGSHIAMENYISSSSAC